jgi:hypothetical protein
VFQKKIDGGGRGKKKTPAPENARVFLEADDEN